MSFRLIPPQKARLYYPRSSTLDAEAAVKYADGSTTQCVIHVVQGARGAGVGLDGGHLYGVLFGTSKLSANSHCDGLCSPMPPPPGCAYTNEFAWGLEILHPGPEGKSSASHTQRFERKGCEIVDSCRRRKRAERSSHQTGAHPVAEARQRQQHKVGCTYVQHHNAFLCCTRVCAHVEIILQGDAYLSYCCMICASYETVRT